MPIIAIVFIVFIIGVAVGAQQHATASRLQSLGDVKVAQKAGALP